MTNAQCTITCETSTARQALDALRHKWESLQAQTSLPLDDPDDIEGPRDWAFASSAPLEAGGIQTPAPRAGVTSRRRNPAAGHQRPDQPRPRLDPLSSPGGRAVRGGLAATPHNEGGRRNLASRRSAAPARKEV